MPLLINLNVVIMPYIVNSNVVIKPLIIKHNIVIISLLIELNAVIMPWIVKPPDGDETDGFTVRRIILAAAGHAVFPAEEFKTFKQDIVDSDSALACHYVNSFVPQMNTRLQCMLVACTNWLQKNLFDVKGAVTPWRGAFDDCILICFMTTL